MEITKLSTKGQIVIPEKIRTDLSEGTPFIVTRQNDLIILKRVEGLTQKEQEEMKELNEIWKEIDKGECQAYEENEFFDMLKQW